MSPQSTIQLINDLQKTLESTSQELESFRKKHEASSKARQEQEQAIIDSLDTRIAEYENYQRMNAFQQFFYRLFKNPSWL